MRRTIAYSVLSLCVLLVASQMGPAQPSQLVANEFHKAPQGIELIAHAGGGLPEGIYANSIEAMDLAVVNGFKLIEIDFSWTSDKALVAIHDWHKTYSAWFHLPPLQRAKVTLGKVPNIPDFATFNALSMRENHQQFDLRGLASWLQRHPEVRIIADIKQNRLEALKHIAEVHPDLIPQIIPEISEPDQLETVVDLGWHDMIFVTYNSKLSNSEIVEFAKNNRLFAIALPLREVKEGRHQHFAGLDTPLFTHTVNDPSFAAEYRDAGIEGLYTDFLIPQRR